MKGVFQGITPTLAVKALTLSPSQSSQLAKHQKETTDTTSKESAVEKTLNIPDVWLFTQDMHSKCFRRTEFTRKRTCAKMTQWMMFELSLSSTVVIQGVDNIMSIAVIALKVLGKEK